LKLAFAAAILALTVFPQLSSACSFSCFDDGVGVQSSFKLRMTLDSKPLTGVDVVVKRSWDFGIVFSGMTGNDGTVEISGLPPGEYWIDATLLGLYSPGCFYVKESSPAQAKDVLTLEWGQSAPTTRQVQGRLRELAVKPGDVLKDISDIYAPIPRVALRLEDPFTHARYNSRSDDDGQFSFGTTPNGVYVLTADGGAGPKSARNYDVDHLLIKVSDVGDRNVLLLTRGNGVGMCGSDSSFDLRPEGN
jgi:hypothetical protein